MSDTGVTSGHEVQRVPETIASKLADRIEGLTTAISVIEKGRRKPKLQDEAMLRERHSDLSLSIQYLVQLRRAQDAHEALGKVINKIVSDWNERVIPEKLDVAKTTNITVEGFRVVATGKPIYSIRADSKDEALAWLKANDLGELIIDTVNASTLSASGKTLIQDHGKELPEELFNFVVKPGISVTRTGAAKVKKPKRA